MKDHITLDPWQYRSDRHWPRWAVLLTGLSIMIVAFIPIVLFESPGLWPYGLAIWIVLAGLVWFFGMRRTGEAFWGPNLRPLVIQTTAGLVVFLVLMWSGIPEVIGRLMAWAGCGITGAC